MNKFSLIFIFTILFLTIIYLKVKVNLIKNEQYISQNKIEKWREENKKVINIDAEKYLIYNLNTEKIISSNNESVKSPIASISKVVTVATFLKAFKENKLNINDEKFAYAKSKIQKALIQSDNEDAEELGKIYKQIWNRDLLSDSNIFLANLGIQNFKFINLTGLDVEKNNTYEVSNFLSTEDLAKVFKYVFKEMPEIFEYTKFKAIKTEDGKEIAINTNDDVENTYGLLISKTGYTEKAKGNLAAIINFSPNENYLIVVLQSGKESRFSDMQKLISIIPNIQK
jgi:D-alanyl-D-alanine carboxypeptidase